MTIENWQRAGFGVYIHWPYCLAKCPYCDFNSYVSKSVNVADWRAAFLAELERYATETPDRVVSSIFFGGGTPSLMEPSLVQDIIDKIAELWTPTNGIEITLEANPSTIEASRFHEFRSAGVNRVSIGVQALNDGDLRRLGRTHSAKEALNCIDTANSLFERVSFDLIYGRQDQDLSSWDEELRRALALDPTHLSLYHLTIEDGTVFGDRHRRGKLPGLPDEDLSADFYNLTNELCESQRLNAYEVSNHAVCGQESIHNLIYWNGGDYLGIGPGAHGRLTSGDMRIATETHMSPKDWLTASINGTGESHRERITDTDVLRERFLMGLRLSDGIMLDERLKTALDLVQLKAMGDLGFLDFSENRIRVTPEGRPILNGILREILN